METIFTRAMGNTPKIKVLEFLIEGREMILEELDRFGEVPSIISSVVNQIEDKDLLKSFLRCAIRCASLEEFKQALNGRI